MGEEHESYVLYAAVFPGQHTGWLAKCDCGWKSERGNETQAWRYRDEHRLAANSDRGEKGGG